MINRTTSDLYLEYQAVLGWQRKKKYIPKDQVGAYTERLRKELDIFAQAGISDYFLILQGIMDYCYENNIPVGPGRGSAAGCLTSWLIDITMVDPIKYGLLLERFYNPGRAETRELPDIDVDVSKLNRDKIINEYIIPKYSANNVCPIVAFGTMQPKMCIKDIGRVLSIPVQDTDTMAKLISVKRGVPMSVKETLADEDDGEPTFNARKLREYKEKYPELFKWVELIEDHNLVRTKSVHAAGIIIAPEPVGNIIPVEWNASKKLATTGYDMHTDPSGLLKLDLLGLRNTDVLQDTISRCKLQDICDVIEKVSGKKIRPESVGTYRDLLEQIPMDDGLVYDQLSLGYAKGVFQFESHFMRSILTDVKPEDVEDLSLINALGRPGPLDAQIDVTDDILYEDGIEDEDHMPQFLKKKRKSLKNSDRIHLNMIEVFAARKAKAIKVRYTHEKLEPILKVTLGVIVYQEQVMRIAVDLGGYTLGEADKLRKVVGKKLLDKMPAHEEKFVNGCIKNGIDKESAQEIWEQIKTFASYGFNKSHSISYSILAYYTAWFKFHFPAEFMAALISSDHDVDRRRGWLEDAKEVLGLEICPPDINDSEKDFGCKGVRLIFGLNEIKGVGSKAVTEIIKKRENGPFKDLFDFYKRVDLSIIDSGVMNALISAGTFVHMGYNKPTVREWDATIRDRRGKRSGMATRRANKVAKLETILNTQDVSKMPKKYKGDTDAYMDKIREDLRVAKEEYEQLNDSAGWFEELEEMPDEPLNISLAAEENVLGCAVTGSLASPYKKSIKMFGRHTTVDCKEAPEEERRFVVCGVFSDLKFHIIKNGNMKGQEMVMGKLIDNEGTIEILIFPNKLDLYREFVIEGNLVQLTISRMNDGKAHAVNNIRSVEELHEQYVNRSESFYE